MANRMQAISPTYQRLLQANRLATVPGTGVVGLAQNRLAADARNPRPWLDRAAMATMPIPVVGDVMGAAADVAHYATNEEARTPINMGLSALGLLPFVPGITAYHGSPHRINNVVDPIPPARLEQGLRGDPGYVYHATNAERLDDIARRGRLETHEPWDFTDQHMWPDGGVEPRAYFGESPEHLWQFAPEEGAPAIVRSKRTGEIVREPTGDLFSRSPIEARDLEYLGEDNAWHSLDALEGAPYGRFDLDKIGTGEGAQAYGHGIYLAENPGVARSYQGELSGDLEVAPEVAERLRQLPRVGNTQADAMSVLAGSAMDLAADPQGVAAYFRRSAANADVPGDAVTYNALADAIDAGEVGASRGHFYTVDLPDEQIAKMLDWDAPLSEQPEIVEALRKSDHPVFGGQGAGWRGAPEGMFDKRMATLTGQDLVIEMGRDADASRFLSDLGIPGIRYFDGGSRASGEGTRNFVVFSPDTARILSRE